MGKLITQTRPHKRESYDSYRNGEVETLTFEDKEVHLCYGEDSNGEIWDFCSIAQGSVTHMDDKLSDEEIKIAQEIIDNVGF